MLEKIKRILFRRFDRKNAKIQELFQKKNFLEAYAETTNLRVEKDPKQAIGGHWEKLGKHQIQFLLNQGLKESDTLLDLGCGTLRAGIHIIKHLAPTNYTGIDISEKAIEYGKELLKKEGLEKKNPNFYVNKDLKFNELTQKYDYILAQSVFTHLPEDIIIECFQNLNKIMHAKSKFYFTCNLSDKQEKRGIIGFHYPFTFFEQLAIKFDFKIKDISNSYLHPFGQNMILLEKKTKL